MRKQLTDQQLIEEAKAAYPNAISNVEAVDELARQYYKTIDYFEESLMSREADLAKGKYHALRKLHKYLQQTFDNSQFIIIKNKEVA